MVTYKPKLLEVTSSSLGGWSIIFYFFLLSYCIYAHTEILTTFTPTLEEHPAAATGRRLHMLISNQNTLRSSRV